MYVPFDDLPDHSRLWIYLADRKFSEEEEKVIRDQLLSFCEQWEAHGNPLKTSFRVDRGQFLILSVDEGIGGASGCSIDGSVRVLKSLQERLGIDFLSRSRVPFLLDGEVKLLPVRDLKQAFADGILGPATSTFHLLAATKSVLESDWILSAEKTWMAQYLPKAPVA
jgi:hypothetical protein